MTANAAPAPDHMPPPRSEVGVIGWMSKNLFSNWFNTILTLVSGVAIALALIFGLIWVFRDAEWGVIAQLGGRFIIGQYNTDLACPGNNCFWRPQASLLLVVALLGMVWGMTRDDVARNVAIVVGVAAAAFAFLPYGFDKMGIDVRLLLLANLPALAIGWALARYTPLGTGMRVGIAGVVIFVLTLLLWRGFSWIPGLQRGASGVIGALSSFRARCTPLGTGMRVGIAGVVIFILTLLLLRGVSWLPGMQPVSVIYWGGLMINLILAVAGITLSLPIGIALALGRRSRLPVVKVLCVGFIEIFRGVPLITLLFMSQVLIPLVFPENFPLNSLARAGIIITLFSAAYMAENIRGGLQALHPGQAEAARALGLAGWQTILFISLPQAIRNVIPAIVGQFIGLFKDTSLVYIIAMLDIVETGRTFILGNPEFLANAREMFVFLAVVFWIFTYGMSYISGRIEDKMGVGRR